MGCIKCVPIFNNDEEEYNLITSDMKPVIVHLVFVKPLPKNITFLVVANSHGQSIIKEEKKYIGKQIVKDIFLTDNNNKPNVPAKFPKGDQR